ncbi:hypothetical protein SEA_INVICTUSMANEO_95 [Mycobacterium phage InvictusManeo]|nr:hypothetical protein SEA_INVICTUSMANEO_95 [Mycobacterium phage InvictusManeo]
MVFHAGRRFGCRDNRNGAWPFEPDAVFWAQLCCCVLESKRSRVTSKTVMPCV